MAKAKKPTKSVVTQRASAAKLTAEQSLKRMRTFAERKEQFVGAVRKGKDRSIPA
jgi:hypothetical protein